MHHDLSISIYDLDVERPKKDLLSKKLIYYMHCITYVLEKWTTVVVSIGHVSHYHELISRV